MSVIKLRPWAKPGDIFFVWRPENGETEDDAHEIEAHDEESAAEDWAEYDDAHSAEYSIVNGNEAIVCVRRKDGGEVHTFVVSGQAVPEYSARRKT